MSVCKKLLNTLLSMVLLTALLTLAAKAEPLYRMTLLPQDFNAAALDGRGRVVGSAQGGLAVWSPASTSYFGALLPGAEALATNDSGTVVGLAGASAFIFANGGFATIGAPALGTWATAVNDAGQVAGFDTEGLGRSSAFLYQDGAFTPLGTLGGEVSIANAINAAGHVAGFASLASDGGDWPDPVRHATIYRDGRQHDLGTLGGRVSEANDINDAGFAAGWSELADGFGERPFLFAPGDNRLIDLGSLGGVFGRANALNDAGTVVGLSDIGGPGGVDYHAFVYGAGGMLDLNLLVAALGDWQLMTALDVNDAGQILAQACRNGLDDCRAARLDLIVPVPEPGSWTMLVAGLLLLLWRRRRPVVRIAPLLLAASIAAAAAPAPVPAQAPAVDGAAAAHAARPGAQAGRFSVVFIPPELNPSAINGKGHVAGSNGAAAVWDGVTVRDYAAQAPGSTAAGINDHGQLAGGYGFFAHVFSAAGIRNVARGVLVGESYANGVNDRGAVVGNAYYGAGERGRGFVVASGVSRPIPSFGGTWSSAGALNRHGHVTGNAAFADDAVEAPHFHGYVYRDKVIRSVGTLGGKNSSAADINDGGQVTGYAETDVVDEFGNVEVRPFLYAGGAMSNLGTLAGGNYALANGLNNAGAVVGDSAVETPDGPAIHAFLYENGAMCDLNDLSALPEGWILVGARDINDARQILAQACNLEECLYVRLDPPPTACGCRPGA